jgi:serine acetyltransferase
VSNVEIGQAVTIYQNTTFCAAAQIDEASVVLTGAIVGHGCRIGRCCVIAPGAVLNARVELGDGVYVGTNASVLPDLKVGSWATIGANSAVVQDIAAGATVMGVPAQVLIPGRSAPEQATTDNGKAGRDYPTPPAGRPRDESDRSGGSDALSRLRAAQEAFIKSRKVSA